MKKTLCLAFAFTLFSNVSVADTSLLDSLMSNTGTSPVKQEPVSDKPTEKDIKYTIISSVVPDINHKINCGYELSEVKYSFVYSYDLIHLNEIGVTPDSVKELAINTFESEITSHIGAVGTIYKVDGVPNLRDSLQDLMSDSLRDFIYDVKRPVLIQKTIASEYDDTGNCQVQ